LFSRGPAVKTQIKHVKTNILNKHNQNVIKAMSWLVVFGLTFGYAKFNRGTVGKIVVESHQKRPFLLLVRKI
jgi:hypothetical protein